MHVTIRVRKTLSDGGLSYCRICRRRAPEKHASGADYTTAAKRLPPLTSFGADTRTPGIFALRVLERVRYSPSLTLPSITDTQELVVPRSMPMTSLPDAARAVAEELRSQQSPHHHVPQHL